MRWRNRFLKRFKSSRSYQQLKVFRAIERCRTAALGGHRDKCVGCEYEAPFSYNSCRSRCCPKCQARARQRWIEARQQGTAPTNYFHVVFTVPHELNAFARTSPGSHTTTCCSPPAPSPARSGRRSETSRRRDRLLLDPPYLGIEPAAPSTYPLCGSRRRIISGPSALDHTSHPLFLLPAPCLRIAFRTKFLDGLKRTCTTRDCLIAAVKQLDLRIPKCSPRLHRTTEETAVGRHIRPPFGGPEQVLRYLGRYTHRIAISNHRLVGFDGKLVRFRWKDYAHGGKQRIMKLKATEFLRRFFLHVLPKGFVRIRHYGLLSNRFRKPCLSLAQKLLRRRGSLSASQARAEGSN